MVDFSLPEKAVYKHSATSHTMQCFFKGWLCGTEGCCGSYFLPPCRHSKTSWNPTFIYLANCWPDHLDFEMLLWFMIKTKVRGGPTQNRVSWNVMTNRCWTTFLADNHDTTFAGVGSAAVPPASMNFSEGELIFKPPAHNLLSQNRFTGRDYLQEPWASLSPFV